MKQINLLPDRYLQARRRRRWVLATVSAGALALVLGMAWGVLATRQVAHLDQQIAELQQQVTPRRQQRQRLSDLRSQQDQLRQSLQQYQALEMPLPISSVLGVLEQAMPESVALTDVTCVVPPARLATAADPSANGGDKSTTRRIDLSLEGLATAETIVGQFVSALSARPLFEDVTLAYCRQRTNDAPRTYAFRLELRIPLDRHRFIVERHEVAHAH